MRQARFDVVVAGAGPAGSTAALVLARAGARVALVDKFPFPRDKACGDLIGPRGVQVLADLAVALPGAQPVGDMLVVGPTGRRVRLPARAGRTYPGHALSLPRFVLDESLHAAALSAGAEAITARVATTSAATDGTVDGVVLADGTTVRADVVVGADGATSTVARVAGLVDPGRALWGFALRAYVPQVVNRPVIALLDDRAGRAFPGYGWLFPVPDGCANFGLGVGVGAQRSAGARATRHFDEFCTRLGRLGLLDGEAVQAASAPRLGGWLKMGVAGTIAGRGRVLLAGDAAGLVNPLQGEGIAQALHSGKAAGEAILAGPDAAARHYRAELARHHLAYATVTTPLHAALLHRPWTTALLFRAMTTPPAAHAVAGAWALYWNALLDGARPGPAKVLASSFQALGRLVTGPGATRRRLVQSLANDD